VFSVTCVCRQYTCTLPGGLTPVFDKCKCRRAGVLLIVVQISTPLLRNPSSFQKYVCQSVCVCSSCCQFIDVQQNDLMRNLHNASNYGLV
jgi:hypothetical protein